MFRVPQVSLEQLVLIQQFLVLKVLKVNLFKVLKEKLVLKDLKEK